MKEKILLLGKTEVLPVLPMVAPCASELPNGWISKIHSVEDVLVLFRFPGFYF